MNHATYQPFMNLCRKNGWKCTAQRLAIYEFLLGNRTHPDVDSVWHAAQNTIPSITRESVYRILNEFSNKSIIARLDHIENARYDSCIQPHGHFICERCGKIVDFPLQEGTPVPAVHIPGSVLHMEFRLVGVCDACKQNFESSRISDNQESKVK